MAVSPLERCSNAHRLPPVGEGIRIALEPVVKESDAYGISTRLSQGSTMAGHVTMDSRALGALTLGYICFGTALPETELSALRLNI